MRSTVCVAIALVALGLSTPAAGDPEKFTIDPVMAKGPADAPVTIVEFSDYQ